MADWRAISRITQAMQEARDENPRGDPYRTLPMGTLINMLEQDVREVRIAVEHGNDVRGKCADVANYASFILDNWEDSPDPPCPHIPDFTGVGLPRCAACGVRLVNTWVEAVGI